MTDRDIDEQRSRLLRNFQPRVRWQILIVLPLLHLIMVLLHGLFWAFRSEVILPVQNGD